MIDKRLYCETISRLCASEEAKKEVFQMIKEKKRIKRLPKALRAGAIAAAMTAISSVSSVSSTAAAAGSALTGADVLSACTGFFRNFS